MGTRHSTLVQKGGSYKVAQYGQWDGYLSGQGIDILTALNKINDLGSWEDFGAKVDALKVLEWPEIEARYVECGAVAPVKSVSMDICDRFSGRWPHLDRDFGGKIIEGIATGQVQDVRLDTSFPADSLFCEFAYVVDLDAMTFEVYRGFNQSPLTEADRFFPITDTEKHSGYHPVRLIASWPLSELPTDEAFLAVDGEEEEDES